MKFSLKGKRGVFGELEKLSSEVKQFMMMMENRAEFVNSHYQLPLPLRNLAFIMLNNRTLIEKRAHYLKKQFMKNKKFFEDYMKFMNDILQRGSARVASEVQAYSKTCTISTCFSPLVLKLILVSCTMFQSVCTAFHWFSVFFTSVMYLARVCIDYLPLWYTHLQFMLRLQSINCLVQKIIYILPVSYLTCSAK